MPTGLQTSHMESNFLSWLSFHEQSQDFLSLKMSLAKALYPKENLEYLGWEPEMTATEVFLDHHGKNDRNIPL